MKKCAIALFTICLVATMVMPGIALADDMDKDQLRTKTQLHACW